MIRLIIASLVVLAGCSAGTTGGENLTATLVSPTDIMLAWHPTDPGAAGQIVEYASEEKGPYTILGFFPPTQSSYKHPDLIPQMPFYYRIRPYYGVATAPVEVDLPPGEPDESTPDDGEWARPKTIPGNTAPLALVGQPDSAPAGLTPTVVNPNGIKFTWTDRASDEEGFFLEVKASGAPDFTVAAVLDRDVNSVGMTTMPEEKKAQYRVRAYKYGQATNIAHQTTGGSAR
ncbi:fibronectin type III domain-containing protein [Actinocrispum sp. NPDC049592]|uniref:fibronectin type III domain-containing protein n=1 Tax=Actinocrispum sp. NPDC049592 TaxID=3154835 RepID=UPI003425111B